MSRHQACVNDKCIDRMLERWYINRGWNNWWNVFICICNILINCIWELKTPRKCLHFDSPNIYTVNEQLCPTELKSVSVAVLRDRGRNDFGLYKILCPQVSASERDHNMTFIKSNYYISGYYIWRMRLFLNTPIQQTTAKGKAAANDSSQQLNVTCR